MKTNLLYKIAFLFFLGTIAFHNLEASNTGPGAGAGTRVGANAGNEETPGAPPGGTTATVLPALPDFLVGPLQDYREVLLERENTHIVTGREIFEDIKRLRQAVATDAHGRYLELFYFGFKKILLQEVLKSTPDPKRMAFHTAVFSTVAMTAVAIWQGTKEDYYSAIATSVGAIASGISAYGVYRESKGSLSFNYLSCIRGHRYSQELRFMPLEIIEGKLHEISIAAALKYSEEIKNDFMQIDDLKVFKEFIVRNLLTNHENIIPNYSLVFIELMRMRPRFKG